MLKIKLARFGKTHQPHFRIVINEARDKRDGKYVEAIGHYAPTQTPKLLEIDMTAYDAWLKKGAQPTDTVASLADRVRNGKPFVAKTKISKKVKAKNAKAAEEAAQPKVEAAPVEVKADETVAPSETTTE